jgi:cytoskeletal protein CcmA (bactofilin family)
MAYSEEEGYVNSLVGEGSHFRGHLEVSGLFRIDGDFSGSVKTAGRVLVGRNGRADCEIEAATVVVAGVLRGSVYCSEKLILLSSAMVFGKAFAPRIIAEEGVLLDGEFSIRPEYGQPRVEPANRRSPLYYFGETEGENAEAPTVGAERTR